MLTERLETLLVGNATGLVKSFAEGGSASEAFAAKNTTSGRVMQQLGLQGLTTGEMLSKGLKVGTAVAGIAIAKMAFDGVQHFADLTGTVRGFQRVTGATAEDSSRLAAATARMGIDAGTAQTAFGQLTKRIGEGKDTLGQWGVEIVRNRDGSVNFARTLENISEKYSSLTDATQRQAFATENFGKGAQSINALLGQGKENLQQFYEVADRHHQIFSQDDLDKGLQYSRSLKDLQTAFQGVELEVGGAVMPLLTAFAGILTTTIEVLDSVGQAMGGVNLSAVAMGAGIGFLVGGPWGALAGGAIGLASALGIFGDQVDDNTQSVQSFAGALENANGKLDENTFKAARALLEERHQMDDLAAASLSLGTTLDSTTHTTKNQRDALEDLQKITLRLQQVNGSNQASYELTGKSVADLRAEQRQLTDELTKQNPELGKVVAALLKENGTNEGVIGTLHDLASSHANVTQKLRERAATHATDAAATDRSTGALQKEAQAAKDAADAFQTETDALNRNIDAQFAAADKTFAAERAAFAATDAIAALADANQKAADAGGQDAAANEAQAKALIDAEDSALKAAQASGAKAEADHQGEGAAAAHAASVYAQIASLQGFANSLDPGSPLRVYLEQTIARLADPAINSVHTASVLLETQGLERLQELTTLLDRLKNEPDVNVRVNVMQQEVLGQLSDRNRKLDIMALDAGLIGSIVRGVAELEVSSWRYDYEPAGVVHVGPMAQDFAALFGFGTDDRYINTVDAIGVLLVIIKNVLRRLAELEGNR